MKIPSGLIISDIPRNDFPAGNRNLNPNLITGMFNSVFYYPLIGISTTDDDLSNYKDRINWATNIIRVYCECEPVLRIRDEKINKNSGTILEYQTKDFFETVSISCMDFLTNNGNKTYSFSFCTYKSFWEKGKKVFYNMLSTLTFNN